MLFNKDIADKLKNQFVSNQSTYIPADRYYEGETDVKTIYADMYKDSAKTPRIYEHNFVKEFCDEETAYQVGLPVQFQSHSNNADAIKDINFYFDNISSTLNVDLATDENTYGIAYEYSYRDGITGEFKIKRFSPLEAVAYCDVNGTVQLFMYCYYKELDQTKMRYWEVVDDKYIYHFDDNWKELDDEPKTPHYFGYVPVGIAKFKRGIKDTIFHTIKNQQDIYNTIISDWANEISDIRNSFLILQNLMMDESQVNQARVEGIIKIFGDNTDARFLTKNLNPEFYKAFREILKNDIYSVNHHLDNQTQIQSNTSGSMLSSRINCLRIKVEKNNESLKECIKMRIRCLFRYLELEYGKKYDFRDIKCKFQLNLPNNNLEVAQMIGQVKDVLPIRMLAERFDFVNDGQVAFDMKLEEDKIKQQQEMGGINDIPNDNNNVEAVV